MLLLPACCRCLALRPSWQAARRQKIRAAKLALDVGLSRLGLLVVPAAEVAGRPARGRGVAFERRVAATRPASGGAWGERLPSEATTAVAVAPPPPVRMRMRMRMQF